MKNITERAMLEIKRGSAEIIGLEEIEKLVERFHETGENFFIKAGFDPTSPDLHLGHTVLLHKLSTFQKHGAIVQCLIGDFTATIGDPSGKSETRKMLSQEEIKQNVITYKEQVFKILDKEKTVVVFNSDWLGKLKASDMIELTSHLTVARMLERDDFEKRFKSNKPISLSEFTYPLLQGFDSVHLKSDIEIGGTDQKFNLLMGRNLQRSFNVGKEQSVIMMPILEGLDGVQKMSKSLNNFIGITESPNIMFQKIMSIKDSMIERFFEMTTSKSEIEIEELMNKIKNGINPKEIKFILAIELVDKFHGINEGLKAKKEFIKVLTNKENPSEIETFIFDKSNSIWIADILLETGLSKSKSEGIRLIKGKGIKVNKEVISDKDLHLSIGEFIIQKGKKNFIKVIIK